MKITTVPVNSISQDPANLRKHGERNIDAIVASLRKFGQQHPIVIDNKGIILSGNGRYMAAVKLGWHEIEVVESSLTGSSATAYAIADNRTAELAEWDTTALAETLRALQSEEFDTDAAGYSESEIDALVEGLGSELLKGENSGESENDDEIEDQMYSGKIVAPIYEPTGKCPSFSDMYDRSKTEKLVKEIQLAGLPENISRFLEVSAERHTVFVFRHIAEYYCHADKTVQDLMERSGLVVIDIEKAIENGFVHLTENLRKLAEIENDES